MNKNTQNRYLKLAEHFYKTRLGNEQPTFNKIEKALIKCAHEYRPTYFRVLKNALAFYQLSSGYGSTARQIKAIVNPVTSSGKYKRSVKPKLKRVKFASIEEIKTLSLAVKDKNDVELKSALFLAYHLGCRPAEMVNISQVNSKTILIKGAKKTDSANRGLDRKILLSEALCQKVLSASKVLQLAEIKNSGVQDRIRARLNNLTKKLWPRRNHRINLYTFRHQMGSNLKASNLDRVEIAYLMGHQSTSSIDVYGDKRKGTGKIKLKPAESLFQMNSIIRTQHEKPYSKQIKHLTRNKTPIFTPTLKP